MLQQCRVHQCFWHSGAQMLYYYKKTASKIKIKIKIKKSEAFGYALRNRWFSDSLNIRRFASDAFVFSQWLVMRFLLPHLLVGCLLLTFPTNYLLLLSLYRALVRLLAVWFVWLLMHCFPSNVLKLFSEFFILHFLFRLFLLQLFSSSLYSLNFVYLFFFSCASINLMLLVRCYLLLVLLFRVGFLFLHSRRRL